MAYRNLLVSPRGKTLTTLLLSNSETLLLYLRRETPITLVFRSHAENLNLFRG
jgi:hypothetical protein